MTKVILTGVDGSEPALNAAKKAADLASAYGGELYVLTAFQVDGLRPSDFRSTSSSASVAAVIDAQQRREEQQASQAERTAAAAAETLRAEFPQITIHAKAAQGGPADVIIRQADELGADVVVVGNKRVQGVKRILGSIAGQIAREVNCDLFVAHTYVR